MSSKSDRKREALQRRQQQAADRPHQGTTVVQATAMRSAPLPLPSELEQYRTLDPDLYEKIKQEFIANAEHRREVERLTAKSTADTVRGVLLNDRLGLIASWLVVVLALGIGAYFVNAGKDIGALMGILGFIPSIVAALRSKPSRE